MTRKAAISIRDAEMLKQSGIKSAYCCICGKGAASNHHEPPKGRVGHHRVTYSCCGFGNESGCHGHLHHHAGTVELLPGLEAVADSEAAMHINERRQKSGRRAIEAGEVFELR